MLSRRLNNSQEVFNRLGFKLGIQSQGIYFPLRSILPLKPALSF